jgi:hypothetical protein
METRTNIRITVKERSITVKHSTGAVYRKETQTTSYITTEEKKKRPSRQTGRK